MKAPAGTPRTKQIPSPSARGETLMVARAAFHILYWSAILISGQVHGLGRSSAEAAPASPFERRFQDLDAQDQRLFRAIREGVVEAEARRSATGEWPSPEALAQEGIPPFAPDPIDKARYTWSLVKNRTIIDYLGTPAPDSGRQAVAVVITEPEPGTAVDPLAQVDEIHHKLRSGAMIHVNVWMGPALGPVREPLAVLPLEQGWKQILASPTAVR